MSGRCMATRLRDPMSQSTTHHDQRRGLGAEAGQERAGGGAGPSPRTRRARRTPRPRRRPRRSRRPRRPPRLGAGSSGRMPRARSRPWRTSVTTNRSRRWAPPTWRRWSWASERTRTSRRRRRRSARARRRASVQRHDPRIAPARSVSRPTRAMTSSIASSTASSTSVVTVNRQPQPVATTRSWWRRCRSRRLARRVPVTVTGRSPVATVSRCATARAGRDDDARAGHLGAPAQVEVLAQHG